MKTTFIFSILFFTISINCFPHLTKDNRFEMDTILADTVKKEKDIRIPIVKIVGRHLKSDLLFKTPKNSAFFFSISLLVDSIGNVEMVFFSNNLSKQLLNILNPNQSLVVELRKISISDTRYWNKILLFPILLKRPEDKSISNLSEFLADYENLWPLLDRPQVLNKQLILLKPFVNDFFDPIR